MSDAELRELERRWIESPTVDAGLAYVRALERVGTPRERFVAFAAAYGEKGVNVVAISSNDVVGYPMDAPEHMTALAADSGFTFPYLYDESQSVARSYEAACTPDFSVFDADMRCVYRGQFDGARPGNDVPVTGEDLRLVLDTLLSGGSVPEEGQIPSLGCNIKWKP